MRFLFDEPTKSFPEVMSLESRHRFRTPSGSFVDLREYLRRCSVATALPFDSEYASSRLGAGVSVGGGLQSCW